MIFYHHLYIFPISQKSPEIATKQRTQLFLTVFIILYLVIFLKLICFSTVVSETSKSPLDFPRLFSFLTRVKNIHWMFLILFLIIAKVG